MRLIWKDPPPDDMPQAIEWARKRTLIVALIVGGLAALMVIAQAVIRLSPVDPAKEETYAFISAWATFIPAVIVFGYWYIHVRPSANKLTAKELSLAERVGQAVALFEKAGSELDAIEAELRASHAKAAELKAEAEQYEQLAGIHKEAAEAVQSYMRVELANANKSTNRSQLLFFLLGLAASLPIQMGGQFVWEWMQRR